MRLSNGTGTIAIGLAVVALAAVIAAPRIGHWGDGAGSGSNRMRATKPTVVTPPPGREIATLAGGCFWAMQTEFEKLRGVETVTAGYSGGKVKNPSYEQVCDGDTGHAESIRVVFDPKVISYADLIRIFLMAMDPTTLNRQGNDEGEQYRSAIFYHTEAQRVTAKQVIKEITARHVYRDPIVTEVTPYTAFFPAEKYHQDYSVKNPDDLYIVNVVDDEVARFVKLNQPRLKQP